MRLNRFERQIAWVSARAALPAVAALLTVGVAPALSDVTYGSGIPITDPADPSAVVTPIAVNDQGQVAGDEQANSDSTTPKHAVVFANGALAHLPEPDYGSSCTLTSQYSYAEGISNTGTVAGEGVVCDTTNQYLGPTAQPELVFWDGSASSWSLADAGQFGSADAISPNGTAAGFVSDKSSDGTFPDGPPYYGASEYECGLFAGAAGAETPLQIQQCEYGILSSMPGVLAVNDTGQLLQRASDGGYQLTGGPEIPSQTFCPEGNTANLLSDSGLMIGVECLKTSTYEVWNGNSDTGNTLTPYTAGGQSQPTAISAQGVVFGRSNSDSGTVEWTDPTNPAVAPVQIQGILGTPELVSDNGEYLVTTGNQGAFLAPNQDYYLYKLGCGSGSARDVSSSERSRLLGAATTGSSPCSLNVSFKPTAMLSGLSRDDNSGAAFIRDGGKCTSGCESVTVTVTDAQNKPVANAAIDASVTPITTAAAPYPLFKAASPGYLCSAAKPTDCGAKGGITGLKTNGTGQIKLLYWAPGVTSTQTAQITVKASASNCGTTQCTSNALTGEGTMPVTVKPHLIYSADMSVPEPLAEALADWADGVSWKEILTGEAKDTGIEKIVKKAAEYLTEDDEVVERAESTVGPVVGGIEAIMEISRQLKFMEVFLAGFKLSPVGLGAPPDQPSVSFLPRAPFENAFTAKGNVLQIGSTGLLWKLALAEVDHKKGKLKEQAAHLNVFEVSYCAQGQECGPGYHNEPGIRPYLDFEMTVSGRDITIMPYTQIVFPYNARAWMRTQFLKH